MVQGVPTNYQVGFVTKIEYLIEYLIEYRCRLATQRSIGEYVLFNK